MPLAPGTRLGPYEISGLLGAGGMGEVYRARDTRLGRDVAVKVIPEVLAGDKGRLRRFEQEARHAGSLNHPNILTLHDVGADDGVPYLVTELLEGCSLRDLLAQGPLPLRQAVDYAQQIGRGLSAAHAKGIVHRDLKPANVFVTIDGRAKVLDFGLAKLAHTEAGSHTKTTTTDGPIVGTVGYMAPEQVRGLGADTRADIFAFGAVLYEMLSGRQAFGGDTPADRVAAILTKDPAPLSGPGREVPASLERVVRRCLEKDPEQRFRSVLDVVFALDAKSGLERPTGPAAGAPATARRSSWRRRTLGAGLALLALSALSSGTWLLLHRSRAGGDASLIRAVAVLPLTDLSGEAGEEYFADGMTDALITELAHIEAWKVVSRTSSMRYKRSTAALPEIARALGVDAVLEGTVLRSGGRVRITARLIRAATDAHLWSGSFERETKDVVTMQHEIAQAVANDFRLRFEPRRARRGDQPAEPAYDAYLRGSYFLYRGEYARAASHFEEATVKDPTFALAHALLYEADSMDTYHRDVPLSPRALQAMERARALDDTLAEVHAAAGDIAFFYEWNWAAGEAEYRRAVELDPRSVDAAHHYAGCLHALTRWDEAIREFRRTLELDPLSLGLNGELVSMLVDAHRYPDALAQLQRAIELDPNQSGMHWRAGRLYEAMGRNAEAAAAYLDAEKRSNKDTAQIASLETMIAARGLPGYWQAMYERAREEGAKTGAKPTLWYARVCARAGRRSEALALLEAAFARRSPQLTWIKSDAYWDPLRSDPRFQSILRRMGFPE